MIMDYALGLVLGFAHGLFAAYVVVVIRRTRHDKTVDILLNDTDKQEWSNRGCLPDNRDNKRPVFLQDLPDDLF